MSIRIEVRGLPIAQGNAKAFVVKGRAVLATGVKSSTPLGAWRDAVASEARAEMANMPALDGPVYVRIWFSMPRPQAHFHTPLHGSGIRETAPIYHSKKPDVDKLIRAVLDAITNVVIRDDSLVARIQATKLYERADNPVGAVITVERLAMTL